MKKIAPVFVGALLVLSAVSCFSDGETEMKPIAGASSFYLSGADLDSTIEKAMAGDAEAALRIYRHYELGKADPVSAFPWLHIAANRGNVDAQYVMGYTYAYTGLFKNLALARFWLNEAARNGSPKAKALLGELDP